MKTTSNTHGFTLPELMVTLAIAAILLAVAVPGFKGVVNTNQIAAQTNSLMTALTVARSEAAKRGFKIAVCSNLSTMSCSPNTSCCSGSADWTTGWIVFVDQNSNGTFEDDNDTDLCEVDAGNLPIEDCLVRTTGPLKGKTTLTGPSTAISYKSSGETGASASFTLTPSDCSGNQKTIIGISSVGRNHNYQVPC